MADTSGSTNEMAGTRPAPVRTEAVGLLAAGLAHDLNNILGGIVTTAELLSLRHQNNGKDQSDLSTIIELSQRASTMVRQILAFSRQEMLSPVTLDLETAFTKLRPLLHSFAGPGIAVDLQMAPVLVRVDPAAFERMVVNLVVNARQAMESTRQTIGPTRGPKGGCITIRLQNIGPDALPEAGQDFMVPAEYGAIMVEDNGPGVSSEIANRIFEPFFTTSPEGQGLGLASVFGLVKQSGGYLLHDHAPLGGARFTIYLPRAKISSQNEMAAGVASGQLILVVDDEPSLRRAIRRGLEQRGFKVEEAEDGEQALDFLAEKTPALLLSDIRMPGMDGVELAQRVRADYPGLPILLISGYADAPAREAVPGMEVGFLGKPFTLQSLGEAVDAAL